LSRSDDGSFLADWDDEAEKVLADRLAGLGAPTLSAVLRRKRFFRNSNMQEFLRPPFTGRL
jgi:hypothetical protein